MWQLSRGKENNCLVVSVTMSSSHQNGRQFANYWRDNCRNIRMALVGKCSRIDGRVINQLKRRDGNHTWLHSTQKEGRRAVKPKMVNEQSEIIIYNNYVKCISNQVMNPDIIPNRKDFLNRQTYVFFFFSLPIFTFEQSLSILLCFSVQFIHV